MLKVTNLRKEYDNVIAVDGVSLEVKRGELFGLLGPNGAGKTTIIRMILNIIKPNSGEITFDGKPFTMEMWNNIGYLPEERGLYRKCKIVDVILYFASLKGIAAKQAKPLAYYWLERFGLKNEGRRKIEELSKGNQQKVQLTISILHNPQLLILDEPFTGLDPVNQIMLKDILLELRQKNTAIVFSTHQMEQVEKMCDNIYLINKGKPVLAGGLYEIKKQYGTNSVHIEFDGDGDFLRRLNFIKRADVYQNYAELELTEISKSRELLENINGKVALRKFEIVEPSLNSIFIQVVGGPEKIELASKKLIPDSLPGNKSIGKKVMKDARVRKALFPFAIIFILLFYSFTSTMDSANNVMLILSIVTIFSAFRFFQIWNKVKKELLINESSKEHL